MASYQAVRSCSSFTDYSTYLECGGKPRVPSAAAALGGANANRFCFLRRNQGQKENASQSAVVAATLRRTPNCAFYIPATSPAAAAPLTRGRDLCSSQHRVPGRLPNKVFAQSSRAPDRSPRRYSRDSAHTSTSFCERMVRRRSAACWLSLQLCCQQQRKFFAATLAAVSLSRDTVKSVSAI